MRRRLRLYMLAWKALIVVALALWALAVPSGQTTPKGPPSAPAVSTPTRLPRWGPRLGAVKTNIPYVDAKPILEALRDNLPGELTTKTPAEIESAWPGWVSRRNTAIRARLERGDEDSVVYLWHYGTSFTNLPPVTERNIARLGGAGAAENILQRRMEALIAGIAKPGTNERLQFARRVVERNRIDPSTVAGKERVRLRLLEARQRVLAEFEKNNRTAEYAKLLSDPIAALAAYVTLFRDRGLSSDTSVLPAFAIEQALETIKSQGMLGAGSVRRVAIVGPGLDFANKDDGHDFYPQQTIQPFAIMDSLIRIGVARPGQLLVTTFDLSPRINQHIAAARERARAGGGYVLHLPLDGEERWNPDLVAYWQRLGDRIGKEVKALAPPSGNGKIQVRAVRVDPAPVMAIVPQDLNIVLERLQPLPTEGRGAARGAGAPASGATRAGVGAPRVMDESFDVIIATNILVYYDVFEQSLALVNVAKMLRPGGLFLSNTPVPPIAQMKLADRYASVAYSDRQRDFVFWYQRQ